MLQTRTHHTDEGQHYTAGNSYLLESIHKVGTAIPSLPLIADLDAGRAISCINGRTGHFWPNRMALEH